MTDPDGTGTLDREELLPLIISQLHQFGLHEHARRLGLDTRIPLSHSTASSRLAELAFLGKQAELQGIDENGDGDGDEFGGDAVFGGDWADGEGLSFDDPDANSQRPAPNYGVRFVSMHKAPVLSGSFSADGTHLATSSRDTTIRVFSAAKMASSNRADDGGAGAGGEAGVVKVYSDHQGPVNEVAWHPGGTILASAGEDRAVRFFEVAKTAKKAMKWVADSHPVKSISFHPSGDYVVTGTEQGQARVYDFRSLQCFTPPFPNEAHRKRINSVRFSPTGTVFASGSDDGTVKIYDTITGRVINTLEAAHKGRPVWSVRFSKNGRYLLSTGGDSTAKCWDMKTGVAVQSYEGAGMASGPISASLSHSEHHVLCGDDRNNFLLVWDARTGNVLRKLSAHSGTVRGVASSPVAAAFASYSDDSRVRYWNVE
ncbi:WD40 repeat-like protein [Gonapodya prolifera JEL478]|uniref:Cleavage stimulation factor 50 kDa subunit n=1 Tax=Gonapodya prolifera (strain JEL478) TaxID=1344416 RepID=A0A139AZ61_GONPJ|nr:WD40 repeat-like protein [Gonapodya prolifera JEL478]|eukprot:KXS22009.1 WD40 repeat-like protein [Gonapodya prolifera JEL478]